MPDSSGLKCSYDFPYCGAEATIVFVTGVTAKPRCAKHAETWPLTTFKYAHKRMTLEEYELWQVHQS